MCCCLRWRFRWRADCFSDWRRLCALPSRELEQTLRAGARTVAGSSRRLHGRFVVSEIALAVVLLVSAGMLGRTLLHLASLDPGVNIHNVLTAARRFRRPRSRIQAKTRAAWQEVLDRVRRVPGVQSVAMVDTVPMREGNNQIGYWTTADVAARGQTAAGVGNQRDAGLFEGDGHPAAPGPVLRRSGPLGQ